MATRFFDGSGWSLQSEQRRESNASSDSSGLNPLPDVPFAGGSNGHIATVDCPWSLTDQLQPLALPIELLDSSRCKLVVIRALALTRFDGAFTLAFPLGSSRLRSSEGAASTYLV